MAWYKPHRYLITEYLLIEQNIERNEELLSWRELGKKTHPIHLQGYRNDYLDGDYDYFFSLRRAQYSLTNLVFDLDVTEIVCGNKAATAASIRKKLCLFMNDWWQKHPEKQSPKANVYSKFV